MELISSSKSEIIKGKNGENIPQLEINEVVIFHWNLVNNLYQYGLQVLHTFTPNEAFSIFFNISPLAFIFLEAFKSEFSNVNIWFTGQSSVLPKLEGRINLTLILELFALIEWDIQLNTEIEFMSRIMIVYPLQKIWVKT